MLKRLQNYCYFLKVTLFVTRVTANVDPNRTKRVTQSLLSVPGLTVAQMARHKDTRVWPLRRKGANYFSICCESELNLQGYFGLNASHGTDGCLLVWFKFSSSIQLHALAYFALLFTFAFKFSVSLSTCTEPCKQFKGWPVNWCMHLEL